MAGLRPETLPSRMRDAINGASFVGDGVGQVKECFYPMPAQLNGRYPALVLFLTEMVPTASQRTWQEWLVTVKGQILVSALNDPPTMFPYVDSLFVPLYDLFSPGTDAYHARAAGEDGEAKHVKIVRATASQAIAYAADQPNHWGGEVFWEAKVFRHTGDD